MGVPHSYYNDSGCFTINVLPQRGECDYYFSKALSEEREKLMETHLNIHAFEKDIWDKVTIKFFYSMRTEVETLAEIIKMQIQKYGEFFGIKV